MKNCATCKHWVKSKDLSWEVKSLSLGTCHRVKMLDWCTTWDNDEDKVVLKPEYANELAFVQDGSSYHAELNTAQNFGCVQHEAMGEQT